MEHIPWTKAELDKLIPIARAKLDRMVEEAPFTLKPLDPMTVEECEEYFRRLMDLATERLLTPQECCIHGQLLAVYKMACRAELLKLKGRYYVISEKEMKGNIAL
jgi:hypothetical protein